MCRSDKLERRIQSAVQEVGTKIRAARKAQKLTQEELSEKANVSAKHLSVIETGKEKNLSLGYIITIADALDIPYSDLFPTNK